MTPEEGKKYTFEGPGVEVFIGERGGNEFLQFRGNFTFEVCYNSGVLLILGEPPENGGVLIRGPVVAAYSAYAWWHVRYVGTAIYG